MPTTHYHACPLCEAICGLAIEVEGEEILSIRGDDDDPLSRGHICPKAVALQDLRSDPDWLRRPIRRRPGTDEWEELEWEAALDETAERIRAVRREHGPDVLATYLGNPNVHSLGALLYGPPLLRTLRTRNRFTATSVDQLPHHVAATEMFGHRLLLPVPDVDRTELFVVLGANPLASNGSMMTAPGMKRRLKELRARGGRLVVVDPRRTETARMADQHLFVRPGTDALLLLALLHTLFDEGLVASGLPGWIRGLEALEAAARPYPAERVAAAIGIDAPLVRELARGLAGAGSAVVYGRLGLSIQTFGGLCQWLVNALNGVTGNLDRPGGAMFPRPAVDVLAHTGPGRRGRWRSRVRGLPEVDGELPVAVLAEEIEAPGEGQIRALLTVAGNPVLSAPDGQRLERALVGLELVVSIDPYLNETTRHAHLILPPTSPLLRDHYDLVFHNLAVRDTARFSPGLFPRAEDERHDWEIISGLHRRLDDSRFGLRSRIPALIGPRRLLDFALRSGPYGAGWRPFAAGLTLKRLERAPNGLDFGPLRPSFPERLRTADRRVDVAPAYFVADLARLEADLESRLQAPANGRLELVGRRQVRSNNSWMHNVPRLMRGADRCTLLLHPDDAARCGVATGERVAVESATGRIEVPVEVSDEMMPGVASLPHGWGHGREGTRLRVASATPGASLNDVTDAARVDELTGNAALSGVPVRVYRIDA